MRTNARFAVPARPLAEIAHREAGAAKHANTLGRMVLLDLRVLDFCHARPDDLGHRCRALANCRLPT